MRNSIYILNRHLVDINPTDCGEETCSPHHMLGPTSRNFYLVHYIFSGAGTYQAGENEFRVTKGQMFIIHPKEIVFYKADPDDPWHYGWVGFETTMDIPAFKDNYIIDARFAEPIFRAFSDSHTISTGREYYICGKIFELISMLSQPEPSFSNITSELVGKAIDYMKNNYPHPISIERLADDLNVNRSYFSTIFKRHMGISPRQYLIDIRLENAATLISFHGYNVTEAAYHSGYTDIYNFSKMFKKKYGISPKAYKNLL